MVSEEAFLVDEQRRLSASDTGSYGDYVDTTSTTSSFDTVTPDPSLSSFSPPSMQAPAPTNPTDDEEDYELQIQRAIRLSLMEGVNDAGQSPRGNSSGDYEFSVKYKEKKSKLSGFSSPSSSHTPMLPRAESSNSALVSPGADADEDLHLALKLSLAEEESRQSAGAAAGNMEDEFPALESRGKGKGNVY